MATKRIPLTRHARPKALPVEIVDLLLLGWGNLPNHRTRGDDSIVARTSGKASDLQIGYASQQTPTPAADPTRCQATTQAGTQCTRKPKAGSKYCWQHKSQETTPPNP